MFEKIKKVGLLGLMLTVLFACTEKSKEEFNKSSEADEKKMEESVDKIKEILK